MGRYDFDRIVDRRGTCATKWMVGPDELPMWIADMDFETAPAVIEALKSRVAHGVFGYTEPTRQWSDAYICWWQRRHGLIIQPEWLIFCTGVVPAISSIVRKLTTPNENVLLQTPVYNIFFNSTINNGCRALECPLTYTDGRYDIDFTALEEKLADPQTSLMILCNPHNPVGRIWTKDELATIGDLCVKYGVTVISDEIHCDITIPGKTYVPFASVSEDCRRCSITCMAPTKAFNMAGLQTAAVCVPDAFLRHKVWRALNTDEVAEPNVFAVPAAMAAFNEGEAWLDELNVYLAENRKTAEEFISSEIPAITTVHGEATYLLWIDLKDVPFQGNDQSKYVADHLRETTGLYLCEGSEYGKTGEHFLRMNLACPKSRMMDGLNRLKKGIEMLL